MNGLPPLPINPPPVASSAPVPPRRLKPFSIVKWVLLSLIILFLLAGSSLVAASYASIKIPLVSPSFQQKVDYWVASIPAIPKTSKQILTKACKDSENIESAKQNFEFSLKSGSTSLGSLTIEMRADSSDLENTSLEARIKGEFGLAPQVYELDFSLTQIAQDFYFKIDKTPDALLAPYGYDLSKIKGKWYQIDAGAARGEIGADVRDDEDIQADIEEKTNEVFKSLNEEKLFQKFKRLSDEKIAGRDSYHLTLSLDPPMLVEIFRGLAPDTKVNEKEIEKTIQEAKFDLWVDKKAFFIDKMEATIAFTSEATGASMSLGPASGPLEVQLGYELSEINQKVEIKTPEGATKLKSLAELFVLVAPPEMTGMQGVLGASTGTAEFGSNALFLERLIHVVTLFPSSI